MKRLLLRLIAFLSRILRRTPLARSELLNRLQAEVVIRLHGSDEADLDGFRIRFHHDDVVLSKRLLLRGSHERVEISLLCSLVESGDTVMDIGANVGVYSVFLSRAVGPAGRVICVEPGPENLRLLRVNLQANGCSNAIICPYALGEEDGEVSLYEVPHHRGHQSLADLSHTGQSVEVKVARGETVLTELGIHEPRVVKIDVEGSEPQVIRGLGYSPEIILFECVPWQIERLGSNPLVFLHGMASKGYSLKLIDPDTGSQKSLPPADLVALTAADRTVHNVLAIRH